VVADERASMLRRRAKHRRQHQIVRHDAADRDLSSDINKDASGAKDKPRAVEQSECAAKACLTGNGRRFAVPQEPKDDSYGCKYRRDGEIEDGDCMRLDPSRGFEGGSRDT